MFEPSLLPGGITASVFVLLMIIAGASDVLSLRIANWLVVFISVSFFPAAIWAGMSFADVGIHLATGCLALSFGFVLFAGRFIGGGDAKLFAAAALWFGFPQVFQFLVFTTLMGGVLALVVSCWSMLVLEAKIWGLRKSALLERNTPNVPYGFALAAGSVLASPYGWWMTASAN